MFVPLKMKMVNSKKVTLMKKGNSVARSTLKVRKPNGKSLDLRIRPMLPVDTSNRKLPRRVKAREIEVRGVAKVAKVAKVEKDPERVAKEATVGTKVPSKRSSSCEKIFNL